MKKHLLLLGFIGLFGASVNAQLEFTLVGTSTMVNGTTQAEEIYNTDQIHLDVNVKNASSATITTFVTRKILTAPGSSWYEQVCYGNASGGSCDEPAFASTSWSSTTPITLAPTETALMNVKITPDPVTAAPAHYRYYVGTQANPFMDSIDITVTSVLSVNEIKKDISLSVSPNPASSKVLIQVSNFDSGNLKIVDVLGNVVMSSSFSGSKSLNVEDFKNGVYFIMITGDGMKAINRKLVVRH